MPLGTEWPCPRTGDICWDATCPPTACNKDLDQDPCVWPEETDPMDLGESVPWPMGANE